jgi:hypothetical protein
VDGDIIQQYRDLLLSIERTQAVSHVSTIMLQDDNIDIQVAAIPCLVKYAGLYGLFHAGLSLKK